MSELRTAVELLDAGVGHQHAGYQLYASQPGRPVLDVAGGEAAPGRAMTTDSVTMWFSSGKPIIATAIGQLWERGRLTLDDKVRRFIPDFGAGKESATIRHLLTHTGGFPYADDSLHPGPWEEMVSVISAAPAAWIPGSAAGYHGTSAWIILGEIIQRVDGRPVSVYVSEEIFDPLGMDNSYLALPGGEAAVLGDRLALVSDRFSGDSATNAGLSFEQFNAEPYAGALSPGMSARGPARELGRLYEALARGGATTTGRVLGPLTTEALIACHRRGLPDLTYQMNGATPHPKWGYEHPWALGMALEANADAGAGNSRRVFASSGAFSSVGFGDPEIGLACVIVCNGLVDLDTNEARLSAAADAVNRDLRGS